MSNIADPGGGEHSSTPVYQALETHLGPPLHPIWSEFTVTVPKWANPGKQHPDPKKSMVPHIVRRCPNVPVRIRERLAPLLGKRVRGVSSDAASPKRARKEGSSSLSSVHKPVSKAEKEDFHKAIAAAFYSAGLSFRVIENPAMRYILTRYRSGMPLPTRQELPTVLFDKAYSDEWENVKLVLEGQKFVAVVCDGWSDPNSESIVNFMVVSSFIRPIFWSSIRTNDDRHTGEYMAAALTKVVNEVEDIVGKGSVCGAVTDNASNMCKSWELLVENVPGIACHGCAAHTLNLVLKDIFAIPYLRDVLKKAVTASKFVRKRPALLYHFRDVQRLRLGPRQRRRTLVIPVSTRWYSSMNCITSIVRNEEVIREVFANETLLERYKTAEQKLSRVKTTLADSNFWTQARAVLHLTEPVVKAVGALEKDACCLSMIYHYFRELSHHRVFRTRTDDVENTVFPDIKSILQKRWDAMKRDSVLAAYLLDPSKSPDNFDGNGLDRAVDACVALAVRVGLSTGVTEQAFYDDAMKFIRTKDGWSPGKWAEASSKAPLDWWRLKSSDFTALKDFATRVLSIPTSSAVSERSWRDHAFIHSKRRNRLKPARVEKLAFLYGNVGNKMATRQVHYKDDGLSATFSECDSDSSSEFGEYDTPRASSHLSSNARERSHRRDGSAASRPVYTTAQADISTVSSHRRCNSARGLRRRDDSSARRSLFSPAQAEQVISIQNMQIPSTFHTMSANGSAMQLPPLQSSTSRATERSLTQSTAIGQVFSRVDEFQLRHEYEGHHAGYNTSTPCDTVAANTGRERTLGRRRWSEATLKLLNRPTGLTT